MAANKNVQIKMHPTTYERLQKIASDEGIIGPITEKPIISQTIMKALRLVMSIHEDPDWKQLRKQTGGSTFSMMQDAAESRIAHLNKPRY